MIPLEAAAESAPRPRDIWIKRDENPITAIGLVIPDTVRRSIESPVCTVYAVGSAVAGYKPGDRVLVKPSAGRIIRFGERHELILRVIRPSVILADVLTEDQLRIDMEEHQMRGYQVPVDLLPTEER